MISDDWSADRLCRGEPYALFYGVPGEQFDPAPALAICARCPVKPECEAQARIDGDIDSRGHAVYGVIAGVAPDSKGNPGVEKECALPSCNVVFIGTAKRKYYCCVEHAERARLGRVRTDRKEPVHGTPAGYKQHRRLGQEACDACKAALALRQQRARPSRRRMA